MTRTFSQLLVLRRKRVGYLLLSCAASALALATMPGAAMAQATSSDQTTSQSGSSVETVVVTAEKRSERLIDVPTSISVVTAQDMQDKTMIELSDIATQVPNVQMQGSSLFPNITIRGVGSSSGTETGVDPAAVVYVDGVYQGRERAENIPLAGIQQIEVLRGPQGTLYGENTIGGAINITTNKPSDQFQAYGDAMFGNLGYLQTSGYVSGPLNADGADNLFASLTGTYRTRDGFIHNAYDNSDLNYDRDIGGRARIVYDATSRLSFDFSLDYLHENDSESLLTTSYALPFPPPPPRTRTESVNSPEFGRREVYGSSMHAAYDFGGARLDWISSYRAYTSAYAFDSDGTSLPFDAENDSDDANLFTQEIRLTSTQSGPFQWIGGLYYSHQRLVDTFNNQFLADLPPLLGLPPLPPDYLDQITSRGHIMSDGYAAFINATYDITPRWRVDAGFRYTIDQKSMVYSQLLTNLVDGPNIGYLLLQETPPTDKSLHESVPTGDISLSYKIGDDQTAYIKFSRGYKAGGFNAYLNTNPFNGPYVFLPEYLNNYELGYKSSLLNGRLTFNGDVFYDDYTNKQEEVENLATFSLAVANAAKATIYGAEMEAAVQPFDGLTFTGTLGLLNTKYKTFIDGGANYSDNALPSAPRLQGTVAGQYEHEIPGWNGWAALARLEFIHQDSSFTDPENTKALWNGPVSYFNGRIGVENSNWGIYVWGNNLTNQYHVAGGLNELVAVARGVNLPLTYGGEITYKY
jgi:iron complex outermembrane receptor protein